MLGTHGFIPFNLSPGIIANIDDHFCLRNTPGSLQVSAAQALGGISDEHKLGACGTLTTEPPKAHTKSASETGLQVSVPFSKGRGVGMVPNAHTRSSGVRGKG